jgi:hypothetical protein
LVSHFQEEDLASFLVHDIGAFHDLIDFEWLLTQRAQDILSVIQRSSPAAGNGILGCGDTAPESATKTLQL